MFGDENVPIDINDFTYTKVFAVNLDRLLSIHYLVCVHVCIDSRHAYTLTCLVDCRQILLTYIHGTRQLFLAHVPRTSDHLFLNHWRSVLKVRKLTVFCACICRSNDLNC